MLSSAVGKGLLYFSTPMEKNHMPHIFTLHNVALASVTPKYELM